MPAKPGPPTEVVPAGGPGLLRVAGYLAAGDLVAFPTETVYGLGADATNVVAVRAVFTAKGRPRTDPLIVHVADLDMAEALGDLSVGGGLARRLATEFWPGPLTVVVPKRPGPTRWQLAPEVSMGPTVGLRCPANHLALDLIRAAGVPVAAPSANRFGRVSPTTAQHVVEELDGQIRAVLDGGPTTLGVESTVVAFEGDSVRVLRPGGVPVEELRAALPEGSLRISERGTVAAGEIAESPGTSVSHYAPEVPVVFTDGTVGVAEAITGALVANGLDARLIELPAPEEAARTLYPVLRGLDAERRGGVAPDVVVVAALDPAGLGRAVNDRLFRASQGHMHADAQRSTIEGILERIRSPGHRFGP